MDYLLFEHYMSRDNKIADLRPEIQGLDSSMCHTQHEKFQNDVLRQVLKFQHSWIIQVFISYLNKHGKETDLWDRMTLERYTIQVFSKDAILRNTVIGGIIGMLTLPELTIYYESEQEFRNRLIKMVIEKIVKAMKD